MRQPDGPLWRLSDMQTPTDDMSEQTPTTFSDDVDVRSVRGSHRRVAAIVAVPLVLAATIVGVQLARDPAPSGPASRPAVATSSNQDPIVSGGSPANSSASCVEAYDLATLKHRAFAFDGTVTTSTARQPPADGSKALPGYNSVTFAVHEWFRGDGQATVTVDLMAGPATGTVSSVEAVSYGVGTRLLVSGEPRFGGSPLQAPIAWGCGFTRSYDPSTAEGWR